MEFTVKEMDDGVAIVRLSGMLNMVAASLLRVVVGSTVAEGHPKIAMDLS
ncbi:MAG: hypothetical protein QOE16_630, partial [Microbacteriaceae bacterium]|nr:hypothetical protein [Microbacteriaceae bacterium]